jgi:site-specific DNA-cytosine methylase
LKYEDNKVNCLTTVRKDNVISTLPKGRYPDVFKQLEVGKHYRYITPIECERLQTVPDNYTDCVSNTQRYRMLGNGWTIDVIVHILNGLVEKNNKI